MSNEGVYVLWLHLSQTMPITIGKLGTFLFETGVYAYAGSAQRNLKQRVARHSRLDKRLHWHIDHLRARADFLGSALFFDQPKTTECVLARELLKIPGTSCPVPSLGSSDCSCGSHLVFVPLASPRQKASIS